jgi:CBS domain containing-hemolysin-like protein
LTFLPDSWREGATHTIAFVIAFSTITTLHIVFGELAPKSLALQRSEATSLWVAAPIRVFEVVFRPIIFALNAIGNSVVRLFGIQPAAGHTLVQSAEELKLAIDASREAGLVEEAAHDLVDRAFLFTDLDVRHAMVPRTEVTAISVDASLMEILRSAAETNHTRLPVYDGDNDHIVGVVNIKRLLPLLYEQTEGRGDGGTEGASASLSVSPSPRLPVPFDVRQYMSEVFAVPETVPAPDVLDRMRVARVQLAVVVDEYGGTAGIVTLEDLVESLVGEIGDESDVEEAASATDGSLVLDGLTTLVEAKEYFDLDLEETLEVETVGGWVFGVLGRPAVVGDEVTAPDGRAIRVEELDGLRVARVRVLPARGERTERRDGDPTRDEGPVGDAAGRVAAGAAAG